MTGEEWTETMRAWSAAAGGDVPADLQARMAVVVREILEVHDRPSAAPINDPVPALRDKAEAMAKEMLEAMIAVVKAKGGDQPGKCAVDLVTVVSGLVRMAAKLLLPVPPAARQEILNQLLGELVEGAGFKPVRIGNLAAEGETRVPH